MILGYIKKFIETFVFKRLWLLSQKHRVRNDFFGYRR